MVLQPTTGGIVDWSFGDFIWAMIVFYFWFMFIMAFIRVFADIFHRNDLSGVAKAAWIFLIAILPFLGILIYLIARPRNTEQDQQDMRAMQEARQRMGGYSSADEIAKLGKLRDEGKLSADEFETLKQKALV
jgi:hypothetical protein